MAFVSLGTDQCLWFGNEMVKFGSNLVLTGTAGACRGEHSPQVPGPVLFQEQVLRRGVPLCSALLWLQWCKCDYNLSSVVASASLGSSTIDSIGGLSVGPWRGEGSVEADLTGQRSDWDAVSWSVRSAVEQQYSSPEGFSSEPHLLHSLTFNGHKMDNLCILRHETCWFDKN